MLSEFRHRDAWLLRFRPVFAFVLFAHGVAHLVGTQEAVEAARSETALDYLYGAWTITSPALLYTLAAIWLVLAAGFIVASWMALMDARSWRAVTVPLALVSIVLSALALPTAWIGVVVNGALVALVWRPETMRTDPAPPLVHH